MTASTLTSNHGKHGYRPLDNQGLNVVAHALTSEGHDASEDGTGRGTPLVQAYHFRTREDGSCFEETEVNVSKASVGGSGGAKLALHTEQSVRRLTPVECCRLQGFPDDWLGGNEPPDSPKYAALGDAVTVPVAEWIGRRLMERAA